MYKIRVVYFMENIRIFRCKDRMCFGFNVSDNFWLDGINKEIIFSYNFCRFMVKKKIRRLLYIYNID